jgi:HK97 family phage portal protein
LRQFRNALKSIFGGIKKHITSAWQEIGIYTARFSKFGMDIYANEVVRACIRTLAEHTSKANVKVLRGTEPGDKNLQRIIQYRPNVYMNGKDFLYKVRTLLEINNVVFIYIMRDDIGRCVGLYPMPTAQLEAVEVNGGLYIKFQFYSGITMTHSWEDLAVLRKDYNTSDIWGDSNGAILTSLELLTTTNEGMANAIKSTANIRGILKSTKGMLSPEDAKMQKERFVNDYMTLANGSGIASIDATQEFKEINLQPQIANYKNIEELRNNIYRYFGMNEEIIMSKADADQRESFYESKIETFLLALSLELTNKIFTDRERGYENEIMFESNRMSYMSMKEKLALVAMVDRGSMTPNEWRQALNLGPLPGGDIPIRRLDTAPTTQTETEDEDE